MIKPMLLIALMAAPASAQYPLSLKDGPAPIVRPPVPQSGMSYVLIEGYSGRLPIPWHLMRKYSLSEGQVVPPNLAGTLIDERVKIEYDERR